MLKNVRDMNKFIVYRNSMKYFSKIQGGLISLDFEQGNLHETTTCNIAMSRNRKIIRNYISFNSFNYDKRSTLEEATRILREDVKDITELNSSKLDVC